MSLPRKFRISRRALGVWRRVSSNCLASSAALLLFAFPVFCQQPQPGSALDTEIRPVQVNLEDELLTQVNSQDQSGGSPQETGEKSKEKEKPQDKKNDRMFFIMPNFLTVENQSHVPPISWKEKFAITAKGAFDPYEFAVVGILSGIRQAENAYPAFGQGMEGYGKRYGTAFADQVDGNIMVGAVYPTILRTDPRYFQLGTGRPLHRFVYAFTRIFITRTDSGHRLFNFPEFAGNATAIAISNLYYPAANRGFSASANNWGVQMGIDAFGNELKEFWPDIHRRLTKKKNVTTASDSQ
jgi:hypothetical protein